MNKIIVNHGSFKVKEVELQHGTLTVGRAADNDLKLDDSAVSSHHAKLVTFFNVTYIEDLNSTNGTLVNGRPVKKYTLHSGDIVLLGKHQLLFQGARLEETATGDSTIVMSANDKKDAIASAAEMNKPANAPQKPALKPSKYPMKQEHQEPLGQLHEDNDFAPSLPTSAFSGASRANPATNTEFKFPESNPYAAGNFNKPNPFLSPSVTKSESAAAAKPMAQNPGEKFDGSQPHIASESKPVLKPESVNASALATPSFAAESEQQVMEKPKVAAASTSEPKKNPFQAAFPEESADNIDVNSVPAIGKFGEDLGPAAFKAGQLEKNEEPASPTTDNSSANLYSFQALSQAGNSESVNTNFRANIPVDSDESLLIPAFAKKITSPEVAAQAKFSIGNVSNINQLSEHKISPEIEKLFEEEEKAQKAKPSKKVLEDPSVNMDEEFHGMTPVGINESNRINQYHQRAAAAHGNVPAVGDRTLLKQIITGDREFSPSRNKFEVIQIVLGIVIFVIIALIAVASL